MGPKAIAWFKDPGEGNPDEEENEALSQQKSPREGRLFRCRDLGALAKGNYRAIRQNRSVMDLLQAGLREPELQALFQWPEALPHQERGLQGPALPRLAQGLPCYSA
jgi:hypothetical protein